MKNTLQKLISIVIALAMLLSMTPVTAMAEDTPPVASSKITAFAPLDELIAAQYYGAGEKQLDELNLPDSLTATLREADVATSATTATPATTAEQTSEIDIDVSEWQSTPAYDPDTLGTYVFTPTLDLGGYTLADGVNAPQITVEIKTLMGFAPAAVNVAYTLLLHTDGTLRQNTSGGTNVTATMASEGAVVSGNAGAWTLTLTNFNFETTAAIALSVPDNTIIVLKDGSTNTIKSTNPSAGYSPTCGIDAENKTLTIQGETAGTGKLEVTGGASSDGISCGILAKFITIKSGEVTANGGTTSGSTSAGIFASAGTGVAVGVTIQGGTVRANGGIANSAFSYGIYNTTTTGAYVGDISITGGTVYAKGDMSSNNGFGIDVGKSFSMTGGTLYTSGKANAMRIKPITFAPNLIIKGKDGSNNYTVDAAFENSEFKVIKAGLDASGAAVFDAQINPGPPAYILYLHTNGRFYTDDNYVGTDITDDMADAGATVSGSSGNWTLTLDDFSFTTSATIALQVPPGTKIVLKDGTTNTITSTYAASVYGASYGIDAGIGALTIQGETAGTGKLIVTSGSITHANGLTYGISANSITIDGGEVTATGGNPTGATGRTYGIFSTGTLGTLTIKRGAVVTATGGNATGGSGQSYGINTSGLLSIESGTVTATGGTSSGNMSYGIYSTNNFAMSGGTLVVKGTTNAALIKGTVSAGTVKAKNGSNYTDDAAFTTSGDKVIKLGLDASGAVVLDAKINPAAPEFDGDGSSGNPYKITSAEDLAKLAELINAGASPYADAGKHYKLTADVSLSAYSINPVWTPIGTEAKPFKGIFDGDGHKIGSLTVNNDSGSEYKGLFGYINDSGSLVKNLGIVGANVTGSGYSGGLVGYIKSGSVENCYVTGTIRGIKSTGGIAGSLDSGSISNCYTMGTVTGSRPLDTTGGSGGIVGQCSGNVSNCYSTSTVTDTSSNNSYAGGVVGYLYNNGSVANCAALNMKVSATSPGGPSAEFAGRVVGGVVNGGTHTNNVAFSGMLNDDGDTTWNNKGAAAKDGEDKTAAQIKADGTLFSKFSTPRWTIANGKLPGFGAAVNMPAHITDGGPVSFTGSGTAASPWLITNAAQLEELARLVNTSTSPYADDTAHYKLTADVNLGVSPYNTGTGWTPIGDSTVVNNVQSAFRGVFDGNGKTISGLTINSPFVDNVGFFGAISGATITKLNLTGVSVTGKMYVGGLVGNSYGIEGEMSQCSVTGTVSGNSYVGGVVGSNGGPNGTVRNCYSTANVTGIGANSNTIGGVVGGNGNSSGLVENCYATGTISGFGYVGGVVGGNGGTVKNCVGLNPSVTATVDPSLAGRVAFSVTANLSGLYGLSTMLPTGWADKEKTKQNGENVMDAEAKTIGFWTTPSNWDTTAWNTTIWDIAAGRYPIFKTGGGGNVAVTGVTLNKSTETVVVGATKTLTATVAPATATNQAVTWSSSNTAIATVDASGVVTGVMAGTATITVRTTDGNKTATCTVTVTPMLPTYTVSGKVIDFSGANVVNAAVKIMLGNEQYGATVTTGSAGTFSFTQIPTGLYNLVITTYDGEQTITIVVEVTTEDEVIPMNRTRLPEHIKNSKVEVKQDAPVQPVVSGLQEIYDTTVTDNTKGFTAAEIYEIENSGAKGMIKVEVDKVTAVADQNAIEAEAAGKTVGLYLDLSVFKVITPTTGSATETKLTELPGLLTVTFDLPTPLLDGKTITAIYRAHGGSVDTITTSPSPDGEYFSQSGNTIILHVKKFSTYGLAYISSSGGGGGSSGSSDIASPTQGTYWIELAEARSMAKFSNDNKLDYARSRRTGITGIRKNAAAALGLLKYEHDTMIGKAVGVRLYISQPARLPADTLVSGYVEGLEVNRAKRMFDKWFKNNVRVVSMEQQEPWGQAVEIAARFDFSGMNTKNLYFYSYNKKTNAYSRITQPKYWIDKNMYWHFTTELAGDIIISDGPLERK